MFRSYLKIAWRSLLRHRTYSLLNLTGLAIGMCVFFFAVKYVLFELSYDNYHERSDQIYRLVTDVKTPNGTELKSTTGAMGKAIKDAFPEVLAVARIFPDYLIVQKDQDQYGEENIAYADATLFSVFTLPLLAGNPSTALNAPFNLVLSQTAAKKYFGDVMPVGKQLLINGKTPALVTGVMKDMPANSHFRTDIFISMSSLGPDWEVNWKRFFYYTFLVLPKDVNTAKLSQKITELVKRHTDQSLSAWTMKLEPLKSIYLNGEPRGTRSGTAVTGSWRNVYIFSIISFVVLFIACFNFINLTTAYSIHRLKEVGIRKIMGGKRRQLIAQFLLDALLMATIAFAIAAVMIIMLAPAVNLLTGKHILQDNGQLVRSFALLLPATLCVGLLAGIYPALLLSGTNPISSQKGIPVRAAGGLSLRTALLLAQFAVSTLLIIATIVIYRQLDFMKNHAPGFKKDHLLVVDFQFDGRVTRQAKALKSTFAEVTGAGKISMSSCVPGKPNHTFPTQIENKDSDLQEFHADAYFIDHDFLRQFEITIVAGRAFSADLSSDSTEAMLINEAACKALGFSSPEEALCKRFQQLNRTGKIIGVTKDFHYHSMVQNIRPLTFRIAPGFFTCLTVDIPAEAASATLENLRKKWQLLIPDLPFIHSFVDEVYYAQYKAEEQFGTVFVCMAGIAVVLSCLGLVGLSILGTTLRTREIGIRKVLGASVTEVFRLLNREYLAMVVGAFVIAIPAAWYFIDKWLQNFSYRVDMEVWMFVAGAVLVLLTTLATVSIQSLRAALMNPVDALKTD
jgi:putative ABC transport system permease protein